MISAGKYCLAILTVCTLFSVQTLAQTDQYLDKVVLTNGSTIWGLAEIEEGQVRVYLDQEQTLVIPDTAIKSLRTRRLNPNMYLKKTPGVYYQVSTGVLLGKGHTDDENQGNFSASFISGYRFKRMLGIGLGVGLNYYLEQRHIPLFVDIQGEMMQSKVTPFYQVNLGLSWGEERDVIAPIDRMEGGFYFSPSVGVRWHFPKHSWHFKISYLSQQSTTYYQPVDFGNGNMLTNVEDRVLKRLGLSLGIGF